MSYYLPFFIFSIAQQEAQRAQFIVEKAKQERQHKVVQAEGEATIAKMISFIVISNILFLYRLIRFNVSYDIFGISNCNVSGCKLESFWYISMGKVRCEFCLLHC